MLIDSNIKALSDGKVHWIGEVIPNNYPVFIEKKGKSELFEVSEGKVTLTQDSFDNKNNINSLKKELIFAFGINNISEINQLYKCKNPQSIVIVIEPNLTIFNHALHNKNLSIFKKDNILLYTDISKDGLNEFLQPIIHHVEVLGMLKNITFYFTDYYRNNDLLIVKDYISQIKKIISGIIDSLGNDVLDSLQGLQQNLGNLNAISRSRNPHFIKNQYQNIPAIVVAAGPSLNKNIHELKKISNRAIIIAVDTILERLLNEDIIPDFVCSVERIPEVYDYFYKDKKIPKQVTLIGPPLLDKRIFDEFEGELILPFRTEVREYEWLQKTLNINGDVGMLVGMSCAHMAFGVAHHLGCSPIILIGQDLAYGDSVRETHASGTYNNPQATSLLSEEKQLDYLYTEGYYGTEVKTSRVWMMFKVWYEATIAQLNLHVIDATEGGARIINTERSDLSDAIEKYCINEIEKPYQKIKTIEKYNFNSEVVIENINESLVYFESFRRKCLIYFDNLSKMEVDSIQVRKNYKQIVYELNKIHSLNNEILVNPLLTHNLQALMIKFSWNYNGIERVWNVENLAIIRDIIIKYLAEIILTVTRIEEIINNKIEEIN